MSWARFDDQANRHPKLLALSDPAWRMWGSGLIYCNDLLTDGFISEQQITTCGVRGNTKKAAEDLCTKLVQMKKPDGSDYDSLWHRVPGGYQVHDYLDWNDSRETILRKREGGKNRQARYRKGQHGPSGSVTSPVSNSVSNALRDASQTPLPLMGVTRHTTHNARGTYKLRTSYQYHGSTNHDPEQELTKDYSAEKTGAQLTPVEKSAKPKTWNVFLAICHQVIEDYPDNSNNWGHELKGRMLNQGIDANDQGPKGDKGKLFTRVLAACLEQRKFRKGDGGVVVSYYRRLERQRRKQQRRAG